MTKREFLAKRRKIQAKEMERCRRNPAYFMKKYVFIKSATGSLIKITKIHNIGIIGHGMNDWYKRMFLDAYPRIGSSVHGTVTIVGGSWPVNPPDMGSYKDLDTMQLNDDVSKTLNFNK